MTLTQQVAGNETAAPSIDRGHHPEGIGKGEDVF